MNVLFTSDREFSFWDYSITHRQLLIRSPRFKGKFNCNLDVVFMGVTAVHSASSFFGLTILEPSVEERLSFLSTLSFPDRGKLFVVESQSIRSYICAETVSMTDVDSDFSVTSLKGMGKPQIV